MTVTKSHLVSATSKASGHTLEAVSKTVESFMRLVVENAAQGHKVELRGFGTFQARSQAPRNARNPRTGAIVAVPRRNKLFLKFHPQVKEINGIFKASNGLQ